MSDVRRQTSDVEDQSTFTAIVNNFTHFPFHFFLHFRQYYKTEVMDEFKRRLQARLMVLVKEVIFYTRDWPKGVEFYIIKKQLIRSVTSVGANYYAACRAKSRADYKYKLHIVEEECDESMYWMTLLESFITVENTPHARLLDEMNQVLSIMISTLKTMDEKDKEESQGLPAHLTSEV